MFTTSTKKQNRNIKSGGMILGKNIRQTWSSELYRGTSNDTCGCFPVTTGQK
jgi:hypothetical protein